MNCILIVFLKKFYKINENQIHLIGHGIGAHIAGYIGKNVTGIGRITGKNCTKCFKILV